MKINTRTTDQLKSLKPLLTICHLENVFIVKGSMRMCLTEGFVLINVLQNFIDVVMFGSKVFFLNITFLFENHSILLMKNNDFKQKSDSDSFARETKLLGVKATHQNQFFSFNIQIHVKRHQVIVNLKTSTGTVQFHDVISLLHIQSMWTICL